MKSQAPVIAWAAVATMLVIVAALVTIGILITRKIMRGIRGVFRSYRSP